jgi:anti-sigma-K factor RskA
MAEPDDIAELDVLAGEYVLGTLTGAPRAAFERQLATDAILRARVRYWEDRLAPLASALAPVTPPATLWPAIERALDAPGQPQTARAAAGAPVGWWHSLALWRAAAFASLAVAVIAVVVAALGTAPRPGAARPAVAVLTDDTRRAVWLAEADPAGTRLTVRAVQPIAPPAQRAFELWVIPGPNATPRSLGLLSSDTVTLDTLPVPLRPGFVLAVSVEPPAGSPTGRATGPVVHLGSLVSSDPR